MSKENVKTTEVQELVIGKIASMEQSGEISIPANYSPENALRSAFLVLQGVQDKNRTPALQVCTKESVANALLDTVIQGLSPSKTQIYYIVHGNKLTAMRSYFGTVAVVKRIKSVIDCFAQVIYEGDVLEFGMEQARKVVKKHEQTFDSINKAKILGAYATIVYRDKTGNEKEYSEVMSQEQISKSWSKTKNFKNDVHRDFPEEMAKRTVLSRACKMFINTSDDEGLERVLKAFNDTEGRDHEEPNAQELIIENEPTEEPEIEEPISEPVTENQELKF